MYVYICKERIFRSSGFVPHGLEYGRKKEYEIEHIYLFLITQVDI